MTYSTLMVHLDGAMSNTIALDVAAALATRYRSHVIGIAACQPVQIGTCDGYLDGAIATVERDIVTEELARAQAEFYAHEGLRAHVLAWRSIPSFVAIADVVAEQARCADLIITSVGPVPGDRATHASVGDLAVRAGRPVLVVPEANVSSNFAKVIVAWTDTRECRRAITDALPILHRADVVVLVEASSDLVTAGNSIMDVSAWLKRHDIDADRINAGLSGSASDTLAGIAHELEADLVVAGAYGHSRIREWTFGGVTRDLLLHERRCTLFSH